LSTTATTTDPAERAQLEELVSRAADHDARAWEQIVERFETRVRSTARSHRLDHQDAEDVVQTTWMQLFTHVTQVREPAMLGAYLNATARNESVRTLRNRSRMRVTDIDLADQPADAEEAPDAQVVRRERSDALAAALERLPERHCTMMRLMIDAPALSYAELSATLGMPVGSIGPIRARSLARLASDEQLAAVLGED
jgi:RNA polymerase sigma factor (sigma-70 family)